MAKRYHEQEQRTVIRVALDSAQGPSIVEQLVSPSVPPAHPPSLFSYSSRVPPVPVPPIPPVPPVPPAPPVSSADLVPRYPSSSSTRLPLSSSPALGMSLSAHPAATVAASRPSSAAPRVPPLPSWASAMSALPNRRARGRVGSVSLLGLGQVIPPVLRPIVRAYLLGYASSVAPRLLTVLVSFLAAQHRRRRGLASSSPEAAASASNSASSSSASASFVSSCHAARRILRAGLDWHRFPTFCAALVGGTTLLEIPLRQLVARLVPGLSFVARARLARWLSSFFSSYGALRLLQSRPSTRPADEVVAKPNAAETTPETVITTAPRPSSTKEVPCAGRTLDLTLFAVTRALDVIVGELWARRKTRRVASGVWTAPEALIGRLTDPAIFATSSALVMWAWFYVPSRLPRSYNKWITSAAAVDVRLIDALRLCRADRLVYGQDMGPDARLLEGMCRDYGWPLAWGDPAVTVPFPCTMVHMGCGPSCERHAFVRLARSWSWAMATYLPLNLLLVLRPPNRNPRGLVRALLSAARSSAFLGAFIALFFYGVCLARTRVGPRVLGTSVAARQAIDAGLCTAAGCGLCGWSILIERAARRKDIGLFVAPRALATLLPRRYPLDQQWRETLVFAASTAVVLTAIQENPARVRGFMGGLLQTVLIP